MAHTCFNIEILPLILDMVVLQRIDELLVWQHLVGKQGVEWTG